MNSKLSRVHQELLNLASEMNVDVELVIVEGKNDKKAIQSIGFKRKVIELNSDLSSLERMIKKYNSLVILTDFDKAGKELERKITKFLAGRIKIKTTYRRKFGKLLGSIGRRDIESINNLVKFDKIYK